MPNVVSIKFRGSYKTYYFSPGDVQGLLANDQVIVETARGREMAQVVAPLLGVDQSAVVGELKPVVRRASIADLLDAQNYRQMEEEACIRCREQVVKINLPMKIVSAEYSYDGANLTFFFTSEQRVDFRELVRDLSHNLKVRVELRQVGPRDETKLLGGFGRCGREHCCAAFLDEFSPVSIKMAKVQDLPLNPMKISGVCGRLLCCLGYECEQYRAIKEKMPREGQHVMTEAGPALVVGHNTLEEKVLVEYETGVRLEVLASKVKVMENRPVEPRPQPIQRPVSPLPPEVVSTGATGLEPEEKAAEVIQPGVYGTAQAETTPVEEDGI